MVGSKHGSIGNRICGDSKENITGKEICGDKKGNITGKEAIGDLKLNITGNTILRYHDNLIYQYHLSGHLSILDNLAAEQRSKGAP